MLSPKYCISSLAAKQIAGFDSHISIRYTTIHTVRSTKRQDPDSRIDKQVIAELLSTMNKQVAGKCREGDSRGSDLKCLGDDVVVEADVVPAVAAAVDARPHELRHRPSPPRAA
jgi:hypothetical protein